MNTFSKLATHRTKMADFGSKIADFISKVPKNDLKLSKNLISSHFFSEFFWNSRTLEFYYRILVLGSIREMYAAQNAQRAQGTQDEMPENRPSAHRLGFQTFKAKTILQRLKHGEKLSPEDFFTLRKSLKKILRIIQGNFYSWIICKIFL